MLIVESPSARSLDVIVLNSVMLRSSGVRNESFAISYEYVSVRSRLVCRLTFTGIIFGAWRSRPKIPDARSCEIEPTILPGTDSLNELFMFEMTVTTDDSVIGMSDAPRLKNG